jgi:hypothetical protein
MNALCAGHTLVDIALNRYFLANIKTIGTVVVFRSSNRVTSKPARLAVNDFSSMSFRVECDRGEGVPVPMPEIVRDLLAGKIIHLDTGRQFVVDGKPVVDQTFLIFGGGSGNDVEHTLCTSFNEPDFVTDRLFYSPTCMQVRDLFSAQYTVL